MKGRSTLIFLLGLLVIWGFMSGFNNQGCDDRASAPHSNPASNLFTYIDARGDLVLQNVTDDAKRVLIEGEDIHDYDYCHEEGLLACIRHNGEGSREFVVYHLEQGVRRDILVDEFASSVLWSPGGKYLVLDAGTGAHRGIRIFDMETGTLVKVGTSVISYLWSPGGTFLALGVAEEVEPETPVEDGRTATAVVMYLEREYHIKTIVKGTSDYSATPRLWLDRETLVVEKRNYLDYLHAVYLKSHLQEGAVSEMLQADLPHDIRESFPAETVSTYHSISADGQRVLYSHYDERVDALEVMLYDRSSGERYSLGAGEKAKWVLQAR